MNVIEKLFGTHSERELKMIRPIVAKIESLRPEMMAKSDEELRDQTRIFRERLAKGETLDDLLPEAFATIREASRRVLNMEHYPVQLIGGIVLHQGRIAEMKTGEGKTLVSTAPAYLNALKGNGVFIVTVNDYLAKRDAEWMGEVHRFLGLSVGVVLNAMTPDERRAAYNCDITYVTNNELGFDYLRDNMAIYKEQMVLRNLDYAIIDEVDSVLIDEARTPLIISGQSGKSTKLYEVCDILARQLERGEESAEFTKISAIMGEEIEETGDFIVNEKDKVVNLTEAGVKKVEEFFHIENLADPQNLEIQHNIILALRANNLMFRDKDYVVKDDEVLIVDDEEIVCRGMAQFVKWEKCGFEVAGIAASVDEALRMLEKMSIDVVFTDIRMPEKSGIDLLKEVQEISAEVCSVHTGTTQKVLVESLNDHDASLVTGRLSNNILVHFSGDAELIGKIVDVKLEECKGFYYIGTRVE